jgi:hypothetical protein
MPDHQLRRITFFGACDPKGRFDPRLSAAERTPEVRGPLAAPSALVADATVIAVP